jgi:hypothetical protein
MALVVHGIVEVEAVPAAALAQAADAAGVTADLVPHGRLAAVVSDTPTAQVLPSRANLMAHTRLLEHLVEHTTVLPMQFGVVVPDEDALIRDYLSAEHDTVVGTMQRLAGHVELRLRARYEEAPVIRKVLEADPRARRLQGRHDMESKLQLGERIAAGIQARRAQDTEAVIGVLRPHAAQVSVGEVADALDVFAVSFLVARDQLDAFDAAAEQIAERTAAVLRLELVGPMPPFSFTEVG